MKFQVTRVFKAKSARSHIDRQLSWLVTTVPVSQDIYAKHVGSCICSRLISLLLGFQNYELLAPRCLKSEFVEFSIGLIGLYEPNFQVKLISRHAFMSTCHYLVYNIQFTVMLGPPSCISTQESIQKAHNCPEEQEDTCWTCNKVVRVALSTVERNTTAKHSVS